MAGAIWVVGEADRDGPGQDQRRRSRRSPGRSAPRPDGDGRRASSPAPIRPPRPTELAALPAARSSPSPSRVRPATRSSPAVAPALAALDRDARRRPTSSSAPTPDGRDVAGTLSALLGWGVLVNATAVAWADGGPVVEMSVFGGKLLTTSAFTARPRDRHGPAERA